MYVQTLRQYGMHVVLDDRSCFCILLLFATGQRSGITKISKKTEVATIFEHMFDNIFITFVDISFKQHFGPSIHLSEILSWSGKLMSEIIDCKIVANL